MIATCPNTIDCPCDETLLNLSVENDDFLTFACIAYAAPPPDIRLRFGIPRECLGFCESTLSQDDACLCAQRAAEDCTGCHIFNATKYCVVTCPDGTTVLEYVPAGTYTGCSQAEADAKAASAACEKATRECPQDLVGNDPVCCEKDCPDGRHVTKCLPANVFFAVSKEGANALAKSWTCDLADLDCDGAPPSSPITCVVNCPDGTPFSYTLPAGLWIGDTAQGYAYVCGLARRLMLCLSDIPPQCCAGSAYLETIVVSGGGVGSGLKFWEVLSGSVPPGLTFGGGFTNDSFVIIQGTPTTGGTYTFTVRFTNDAGLSTTRTYTICVIEVSPVISTALVSVAYSDMVLVTPCAGPISYSIVSGALPPGLTLDTVSGVISGTPTTIGTYTFEIGVATA